MNKKLLTALPSIYDAALSSDRWPAALDEVARCVGSFGAVLIAFDLVGHDFTLNKWSPVYPDEEIARYLEQYSDYESIAVGFMRDKPPRKPFIDADVWPDVDRLLLREDVVYLRERFGADRRVGVRLNKDLGWSDMVALQVSQDPRTLPAEFWRTLDQIVPHLAKTVETGRIFTLLRQRYQAVLSSLDRIGVGMCVCDANGGLLVVNEEASRIFDANDGLSMTQEGRVQASDEDLTQAIHQATRRSALAAKGDEDCDEYGFTTPRRSGGSPYLVEVCPLRDSAGELDPSLAGSLITVIDPDKTIEVSIAGLVSIFRLTQAEAALCQSLVNGLTAAEIAEERSVSLETARAEIAALYAKTGVKRRHELIRLALSSSPPIR